MRCRVVGAFADEVAAQRAAEALRAGGFAAGDIIVAGGAASAATPSEREGRFLGRLVMIVVAWSIVGTGLGVVMGLALNALGIGPGGTGGLIIQMASWAVFVHLLGGLWAGYALLTKGESREPVRHIEGGRAVVSVWCADSAQRAAASGALNESGATAVSVHGADGRLWRSGANAAAARRS